MSYRKFLITVFMLGFFQPVFSKGNSLQEYTPGFYFGGQVGYAKIDEGNGPEDYVNQFSNNKEINKGKLGGRLFTGYSFSPYLGLEMGYSYYQKNNYKIVKVGPGKFLDLMAKGILPLEHLSSQLAGWNLFGKLGAAMGHSKGKSNSSSFKFSPSYGLGIGYDFNGHFSVDLSWLRISGKDRLSVADVKKLLPDGHIGIPKTNLIAIGLSYKL